MKTSYIPLSSATADLLEDYDFQTPLKEELVNKWATDILLQINTDEQLTNIVDIVDVRDYKAKLKGNPRVICEVAYKKDIEKCSPLQRTQKISQWVQCADDGCELEINVKCPDCTDTDCSECDQNYVEVDVDRIWELSNPQYHYYSKFARSRTFGRGEDYSAYTDEYRLLKYNGSNKWANVKHLPECANVHCKDCEESYYIDHLPYIETSFKEGELLVSYLSRVTDENGDLMIPDHPLVLEAIGDYIIFKMMKKDYISGGKKVEDYRAYKDMQVTYEKSLIRAKSRLQMPSYRDWTEWLKTNKRMKLDRAYKNLLDGRSPRPGRPSRKNQYR